jgi:hypothetical protein
VVKPVAIKAQGASVRINPTISVNKTTEGTDTQSFMQIDWVFFSNQFLKDLPSATTKGFQNFIFINIDLVFNILFS